MTRCALIVLLAVAVLPGCDKLSGVATIRYTVVGSAVRVSLTYEAEGGTAQVSSATLPWSFTRQAKRGEFLYLSAQIVEGTGSATVTIYKGDDIFKSTTSSGFAAIATASGSLD